MSLVPVVIDKEIDGERSYDIFSRLLKERIIFISGEITDSLANTVVASLLYLDSINHDDISIYINSPGGSVSAGFAIYDTMQFITSDVSTICIGMAASMGAFLLSSGTIGKRYALPNSDIMIHQPLGGAEGQAPPVQAAIGSRGDPGCHSARGLRRHSGGCRPGAGDAALPRAAHRRHRAPSGAHRRNENRRRQDPGGHPPLLPQRPDRPGGPCGHGERISSQA